MGPIFVNYASQRMKNNVAYLLDIIKLGKPFKLTVAVPATSFPDRPWNDTAAYDDNVEYKTGGEVRSWHTAGSGIGYCTTPDQLPQLVENLVGMAGSQNGTLTLSIDGQTETIA